MPLHSLVELTTPDTAFPFVRRGCDAVHSGVAATDAIGQKKGRSTKVASNWAMAQPHDGCFSVSPLRSRVCQPPRPCNQTPGRVPGADDEDQEKSASREPLVHEQADAGTNTGETPNGAATAHARTIMAEQEWQVEP